MEKLAQSAIQMKKKTFGDKSCEFDFQIMFRILFKVRDQEFIYFGTKFHIQSIFF